MKYVKFIVHEFATCIGGIEIAIAFMGIVALIGLMVYSYIISDMPYDLPYWVIGGSIPMAAVVGLGVKNIIEKKEE